MNFTSVLQSCSACFSFVENSLLARYYYKVLSYEFIVLHINMKEEKIPKFCFSEKQRVSNFDHFLGSPELGLRDYPARLQEIYFRVPIRSRLIHSKEF
jgi:hypothetical protein